MDRSKASTGTRFNRDAAISPGQVIDHPVATRVSYSAAKNFTGRDGSVMVKIRFPWDRARAAAMVEVFFANCMYVG